VEDPADLQRDVIKAESAGIHIPELELEVSTGSMGGLVTTVEGLVDSVSQVSCKDCS
jgi:zinc finger protein